MWLFIFTHFPSLPPSLCAGGFLSSQKLESYKGDTSVVPHPTDAGKTVYQYYATMVAKDAKQEHAVQGYVTTMYNDFVIPGLQDVRACGHAAVRLCLCACACAPVHVPVRLCLCACATLPDTTCMHACNARWSA